MGITGWLSGCLLISVKGKFPERFINLCALRGIKISGATKKNDEFIMETPVKTFRKMIEISYITKCRVHIIKKRGLPFKMAKWGKRKVFLSGAALFCLLVFVSNSFIWTIRIDGNKILTEEEIKIIANYCGLREGVVKYSLDENKFSKNALKCEPRLSWIWPEIKGTVCYIHVREKTLASPPVKVKEPCRVIAKRDGIITSMLVKRGWPKVSLGDSVLAGQVLIDSEAEGFSPVHASGEVIASYWVSVTKEVDTEKEISTYTGREKRYYSLLIGSFGMNFRFSLKAPYENYEYEEVSEPLKLFGEILLPIKIKKQEYKEVEKTVKEISPDEAVKCAAEEIKEEFMKNLSGSTEIKDVIIQKEETEKGATVTVIFCCSEDIALTDNY